MKRLFYSIILLVIGAVTFQGFQCASPEMTTGKLAMRNKEYKKAEQCFQKELNVNKANEEAWMQLASVKQLMGDIAGAANALNEGEPYIKDPVNKKRIPEFKNNLWVTCYNKAIEYTNLHGTTKNKAYLDSTIQFLDLAIMIHPGLPEFYNIKGQILESQEKQDQAVESYKIYVSLVDKDIKFAKENNIMVASSRQTVIEKLGAPLKTLGMSNQYGDSMITDIYQINGKDAFIFSEVNKEKNVIVSGWRIDPPENWLPMEKMNWSSFNISPLAALANIYFNKKDLPKALEYSKKILEVDGTNPDVNSFILNIYTEQGKKEEALEYAKLTAEKNPGNKVFLLTYANLLFQTDQYDDAILQYKKALVIDPNFCEALRNIGSCYKNKVVKIQQAQQDKMDKDPKYKPVSDEYMPFIKESQKYFESLLSSCEKFKTDYQVLVELTNLADVTGQKAKVQEYIKQLEALSSTLSTKDEQKDYYYRMLKLYNDAKMKEKGEETQKKLEELEK